MNMISLIPWENILSIYHRERGMASQLQLASFHKHLRSWELSWIFRQSKGRDSQSAPQTCTILYSKLLQLSQNSQSLNKIIQLVTVLSLRTVLPSTATAGQEQPHCVQCPLLFAFVELGALLQPCSPEQQLSPQNYGEGTPKSVLSRRAILFCSPCKNLSVLLCNLKHKLIRLFLIEM